MDLVPYPHYMEHSLKIRNMTEDECVFMDAWYAMCVADAMVFDMEMHTCEKRV